MKDRLDAYAQHDVERARAVSAHGAVSRILMVEDDPDFVLMLTYNLEAEGYRVESVARGEDVEPKLIESAPDLLILDWMLPGVSGLDICARLRAHEATRTLPIIMITARGEEAERLRGFSAGADDYVANPSQSRN